MNLLRAAVIKRTFTRRCGVNRRSITQSACLRQPELLLRPLAVGLHTEFRANGWDCKASTLSPAVSTMPRWSRWQARGRVGTDGRRPSKPCSPLPSCRGAFADGAAQGDQGSSPDCLLVHGASVVQTTGGVTTVFRARLRRYVICHIGTVAHGQPATLPHKKSDRGRDTP